METRREKSKASARVGATVGVGAAAITVLQWLGVEDPAVAGAMVVLGAAALRYGASLLGVAGLAGLVFPLMLGCGTLQPASPEAAVDAGCEAALAASTEALAYLQSPEGRDDSASDREAVVEGMRGARDACFAGRAALQGDGSPEARAEALQAALVALAARVPALESDPQFRAALGRLLSASARFSEEVSR